MRLISALLYSRSCWRLFWLSCILSLGAGSVLAEPTLRIGTGARTGAYFPIATALAQSISQPGQLRVQVVATNGSLANVAAVEQGDLESAFAQADVLGKHVASAAAANKLRLIATLYPESVHIVVRKSANVSSVAGLRGLRVALDEPGSGVLANARQILRAYGLTEREIKPVFIKGAAAAQRMKEGKLDALFFVGGVPSSFLSELAHTLEITLLPIDGEPAQALRQASPYFSEASLAAGTYGNAAAVATLAVHAQWFTHADVDEQSVYQLTRGLLQESSLNQVRAAHPLAQGISAQTVVGTGLPLHPGALRYYREIGLAK
jgi:uncharacterized protein